MKCWNAERGKEERREKRGERKLETGNQRRTRSRCPALPCHVRGSGGSVLLYLFGFGVRVYVRVMLSEVVLETPDGVVDAVLTFENGIQTSENGTDGYDLDDLDDDEYRQQPGEDLW